MIIWLVSYPRSGNTFLRTILNKAFDRKSYSIYGDIHDIAANPETRAMVGHQDLPPDFDLEKARDSSEYYLIKSHEPYQKGFAKDKVIYVIRDGRAATVSYAHYLRSFSANHYSFLEIINGYPFMGSWAKHVRSWQSSSHPDLHWLRFEDMIQDPKQVIVALSQITGFPSRSEKIPDFSKLHSVNPSFFRQGATSAGKKDLNPWEQAYFNLINGPVMREHHYPLEPLDPPLDSDSRDALQAMHVSLESLKPTVHVSDGNEFAALRQKLNTMQASYQCLSEENQNLKTQLHSIRSSLTFRLASLYSKSFRS